jgi:hypothetical protein
MKLVIEKTLFIAGEFVQTDLYKTLYKNIVDGIKLVTWSDPSEFVINPVRKGNGVVPIKNNFITHLKNNGWETEQSLKIIEGKGPGPIDAIYRTDQGIVAVEWETGNISSSHRALNKLAIGILQKQIIAGFLILPMRSLYVYLTDRIGNYEELSPYFVLYENLLIQDGILGIFGIEHNRISTNAEIIPKGQDGNAKKASK